MFSTRKMVGTPSEATSDTTVVVGLDFGTTYSGISWARSTRPSWGYGFAPPEEPITWFKLLLVDEMTLPVEIRVSPEIVRARQALKRLNKGPVEVIADYLRLLWNHGYSEIEKTMGREFLGNCPLKIVATLPAIWPPYAQVRMKEAIQLAGILQKRGAGVPSLSFISEPEAAALASIHDIFDMTDIENDDHYVVCDAGGGTVDLITYTIASKEPMVVKESVRGDGGLCGAIRLDTSFMHTVRMSISQQIWDHLDPQALHHAITVEWENGVKRSFHGAKASWLFVLPFGGVANNGRPPSVGFNTKKLKEIFTPVAKDIAALVGKQVAAVRGTHNRIPKAVILVGGLGKSPFLYQYLEKTFPGIRVARDSGERPWTAVCRGAVIKGLSESGISGSFEIDVGCRISRANYGTLVNLWPFDEWDDPIDKEWSEEYQRHHLVDQTEWFVTKNAQMTEASVEMPFVQDFPADKPPSEMAVDLIYSDEDVPSKRFDETVKSLCRITWSKIPRFESLPVWHNDLGTPFRRISYKLQMTVIGSTLDFAVYREGFRVGSQNVTVEFEERTTPKAEEAHMSIDNLPLVDNQATIMEQSGLDNQPAVDDETMTEYESGPEALDSDFEP